MGILNTPTSEIYDTIIIGGGSAGFTAGIYAARANLKALLIEGVTTSSQITMTDMIENYPGFPDGINGFDLIQLFRKQAERFGLEIIQNDVTALVREAEDCDASWKVTAGKDYRSHTVIAATGTNWRKAGIPREEMMTGRGVSYCATCDGPFYRNKEIIVIGGGDTALQEALFLTRFASRVIIIHRRNRLRATKILQDKALANEKISIIWESVVDEILGKDFVEGVKIRNLSTGEVTERPVEGIFVFTGLDPNTQIFQGIVELDRQGYIIADTNMQTSAPGFFAGGDCIAKLFRQVVTACGDGANAAHSVQLYVEARKGETYCTEWTSLS